ncbi:M14 family metallocarboxypeptidase [Flaviramulus sp. BrNp1-15]|uniref:M14 family metallopeptidase n=1 Tax=Flaviramulus sp. BrNp1-15 TaxID=2916754 RepID=UPI001EE8E084|nr:M14 family metallocarboxypeptidase [Flaviramulus sp. BrNp1-15]ULC59566.1 M14 family metallocarboxypeptidase [Flaviramulus sp. BrNp1-15]
MIKKVYILVFLLFAGHIYAQISPQSKKITQKFFLEYEALENITPALQKKKGFTNYDELISFLNSLVKKHPDKIKLSFIGESQKGYKIPLVRLTTPNTNEKIKVWMQGGLHGNEPASTEGLLYLLDKILNDTDYTYLLDNVDLAIVPMSNIDGYLKQNRYAANGLDLNRDQTKLMAPESVVLKQAFSNFNPEVVVDFHEYRPYRKDFSQFSDFGITSIYDIMFLYTGNLNVPKNIREITNNLFVENARKVLDKNGLMHHDYMSTGKFGGEIHFNQGATNSRSSATNCALANTISTLIEVRGVGLGRTSFKRRINTTFLIAVSYLETAYNNIERVKNEIKKANEQHNEVIVTSSKSIYKDNIKAIDLDSNEMIDLEVTIRDALKSKPKLVRKRPIAYLIDANQKEIIEKLKTLGVKLETLTEDQEIEVEAYLISTYQKDSKKYEKMNLQTVEAKIEKKTILFPKGTFKISMNQRRANIIPEVLEPEAPNSFVSFGVLNTNEQEILPIYRVTN